MKIITLCLCLLTCASMCFSDEMAFRGSKRYKPHANPIASSANGLWEKSDFIWNFAIATSCDIMPMNNPRDMAFSRWPYSYPNQYLNIKSGDTVWLQSRSLSAFCQIALPHIHQPFVLVMNDGDEAFPSDILSPAGMEALLNDDRIIAIFAQNCDYKGSNPKVHHMPIGIDFHTLAYKNTLWGETMSSPGEQEVSLNNLLHTLKPTHVRKKRAFVDFQHYDTMNHRYNNGQYTENRAMIFQKLLNTGLIDYSSSPMRRSDLWSTKGEYAFSISPHGNGLDCHRTWEDLALGCIVIVKTSPLDPMYEGLPVVIVKDWSEINQANLDLWLEKYGDAFTNPSYREKLTTAYWWSKIEAARTNFNH